MVKLMSIMSKILTQLRFSFTIYILFLSAFGAYSAPSRFRFISLLLLLIIIILFCFLLLFVSIVLVRLLSFAFLGETCRCLV